MYYDGNHSICDKTRRQGAPNAKPVCNHAKDISDTATGYFMGNAITYNNTGDADIDQLLVAFDKANVDDADNDLALNMSIYGVAYEYVYAKDLFSKKLKDGTVYEDSLKDDEKTDTSCVNDELYFENPYFVTKYSKTSEKEDRAEIFAELMMQEKKEPYLQEGQHILKKTKLLTNTLEQNVSNNNFYYNKFLN